jgi:hypothetical protein
MNEKIEINCKNRIVSIKCFKENSDEEIERVPVDPEHGMSLIVAQRTGADMILQTLEDVKNRFPNIDWENNRMYADIHTVCDPIEENLREEVFKIYAVDPTLVRETEYLYRMNFIMVMVERVFNRAADAAIDKLPKDLELCLPGLSWLKNDLSEAYDELVMNLGWE